MRRLLLLVVISFPFSVSAQAIDSVAYKQVDSLIKVTRGLIEKKDFITALEVNARAEKVALLAFGEISAPYGSACMNHGRIMLYKKEYSEAEKLYLTSLSINEKALGKTHPEYARNLFSLAIVYKEMGQYGKAEPLFLEAKDIRGKKLGKVHPDYVQSLSSLAGLYMEMGLYEKTESLYLEVIAIREKTIGKAHPDYAGGVTNLANLYAAIGAFQKAEPLFLEAKEIHEKVSGKSHPYYGRNLYNLAVLYKDMGQYEKAELLFLEAKDLFEKANGKMDPQYASCVNTLALVYMHMRQYPKAESLFLEAMAIREKLLGKVHPNYAMCLNNLASLYIDMGAYQKAEPLYLEAVVIFEKVYGKVHPIYARSITNLASLYEAMGQYEKAEPLYLEGKEIREKVLGKEHPDYAESLGDLANFYYLTGQFEKSEMYFNSTFQMNRKIILSALHHLSEKEMNHYLLTFKGYERVGFSFTQDYAAKTNISKAEYDDILFYKGFLLQASIQIKQMLLKDTTATAKYALLKSYRSQLSQEYSKPISERKGVSELEEKSNALEKQIALSVVGYAEAKKQLSWKDVQHKLKPGEAAVEFVNYKYFNNKTTNTMMYAALLIKPGSKQPQFITLFEQKSLDSLFEQKSQRNTGYTHELYTLANRGISLNSSQSSAVYPHSDLYHVIWEPLNKHLDGIKTIYYSPSGMLHRINLNAIATDSTHTLSDRFHLIEMNSTRQLVISGTGKYQGNKVVLFGGIQYDTDTNGTKDHLNVAATTGGEMKLSTSDSSSPRGSWNYLPGTESEVIAIEAVMRKSGFKTLVIKGHDATEESFKNFGTADSASPRVLHIATHGYFFPDPKENQVKTNGEEAVFKQSEQPLLRSGLILSGGDAGWKGKTSSHGKEDGVLTAYEISQINLSNTELVVLSACETGLGDIQGNEGVYGLQRAFKIAGVKYIIMSLWQVPDSQTSLLMTTFYKKWLEEGMSLPDAFHAAQKQLRDSGLDPYFWAGFILVE